MSVLIFLMKMKQMNQMNQIYQLKIKTTNIYLLVLMYIEKVMQYQ